MNEKLNTIIQATGGILTSGTLVRLLVLIESALLGLLYVLLSLILDFIGWCFPPTDSTSNPVGLQAGRLIYWEEENSEVSREYDNCDCGACAYVPPPKPKLMGSITAPSLPFVADPARRSGQDIPIDVYRHVIPLLSKADHITLLRVCRLTHFLIAPIIYPILYTTLHIDLSKDINPVAIRGVPIPCREIGAPADGGLISTIDRCGVRSTSQQAVTYEPLPNRFESTTFLTLTSHTRPACRGSSLEMPNLDTLRVEPLGNEEDLILCRCCPGSYASASPLTTGTCPLLTSLRPRRVILGSPSTGFIGSAEGLWTTPTPLTTYPFPPPFVKELVVVLGLFSVRVDFLSPIPCPPFLQHLPASLDKVTFVMSCYEMTMYELENQGDEVLETGLRAWRDIELVSGRMAYACVGNAKVIEVVADGGDIEDDIAYIEGALVEAGCSTAEAKKRAQGVLGGVAREFADREWWYEQLLDAPKEALIAKVKRMIKADEAQPRRHRSACTCGVCFRE